MPPNIPVRLCTDADEPTEAMCLAGLAEFNASRSIPLGRSAADGIAAVYRAMRAADTRGGEVTRQPTAKEDAWARAAAKRSGKLVGTGKLIGPDGVNVCRDCPGRQSRMCCRNAGVEVPRV